MPVLIVALLLSATTAWTAEVSGTVVDTRGGEPLERVQIQLAGTEWRAVTDSSGMFRLGDVPPGDYVLHVSTVGYRLIKRGFTLAAEPVEFEVVLTPDNMRQSNTVEVSAGPFEGVRDDSPSELNLSGDEARNLSSVLADDPMRAVHALPGVTSNDEFNSFFYLRGGSFHRVGLYLDDVLIHMPFHLVASEPDAGSLTAISGDTLEAMSLHSGAYPARFSDRTVGVLDMKTREGSRLEPSFQASASMSKVGVLGEGPLGKSRKGSWLASARKSYLQYLLRRAEADPSLAFGFEDLAAKINYDLTSKHNVSLSLLDGRSDMDRSRVSTTLGANSLMLAGYHLTVANLGWRYAPRSDLLVTNRIVYMRERHDNWNRHELPLSDGYYGEWIWNSHATWIWGERQSLEGGVNVRRIRDDGGTRRYNANPLRLRWEDAYAGSGLRPGGWLQQSLSSAAGRVRFTAGVRWDSHEVNSIQTLSPHAALVFAPLENTQVRLGWGQYVQYPELQWFYRSIGSPRLLPERATHYLASIEQRLNTRTRVRVEFYSRDDRDLLFRDIDPRMLDGSVYRPPDSTPVLNSIRGYARGFEVFLQRRTANRLTGWISYGYGRTGLRDGASGQRFDSDYDQRHTVNVYGSYRLRP
ncbi:MAG: TonB-dependent receptor, partial [bacterium]|nr:TonB-dependent receptor [bacterium]